ncbi:hypothetical protein DXG01_008572 [Tephrocybe rancida]|nr:hypothetical protein DXG01_008572 [Tephrocybe rancida]
MASVASPLRKAGLFSPLPTSWSVPGDSRIAYSATRCSFEEFEETTLYFAAPSYADLTAYASGPIVSLSKSFLKLYPDPPRTPPTRELATRCSFRVSKSIGSELFSSRQIPLGRVPSIPSIISSSRYVYDDHSVQPQSHPSNSYDVIGTLGNGAHGEVVLATTKDHTNNDLYAVKILRGLENNDVARELATLKLILECSLAPPGDQNSKGASFLQRFREAFQDEEGVNFLVLDYHPAALSDPEIASRFRLTNDAHLGLPTSISLPVTSICRLALKRPQADTVLSVRLLAAEISLGLAFLHGRGLVHQDIKPANILLSHSGHVVIGDFGATSRMPLAQNTQSPGVRRSQYDMIVLGADDLITFTPLYAAPELKERTSDGQVTYDDRSDWWSLGIVLYELVTGTVPFLNISGLGTLGGRRSDGDRSLTFGELEALSNRLEEIDNGWYFGLESFLRSLLSQNPDDRLTWPGVKEHEFMHPLRDLWDDIADLKCPPCPDLPTSQVYNETCSTVEEEADDDVYVEELTAAAASSSQASAPHENHGPEHELSFNGLFNSSLSTSLVKVWEPHQHPSSSHDDNSDEEESISEALPSSASIRAFRDAVLDGHDSGSDVCSENLAPSMSFKIYSPAAQALRSPFSSPPVINHHQCMKSDGFSTSKHVELPFTYGDLIAPEDLTCSLLKAMDDRDRFLWGKRSQHRKANSGVFRRIFGRLFAQ